jgi:hypothetical protein
MCTTGRPGVRSKAVRDHSREYGYTHQWPRKYGIVLPRTGVYLYVLEEAAGMAATPSLSALRRDEDTTDMRFVLDDGTSLLAHRSILALSSPVLRRALFGPMNLPNNESLPLPGKDAAAVQGLLAYCYGEPVVTQETAIPLLQLADEYCIDGLKAMCERWLTDNLSSVDNSSTVDLVQWVQRFRCSETCLRSCRRSWRSGCAPI